MNLKYDDKTKENFNYALKCKESSKYDEAIAILEEIIRDYPDSASAYGVLGGIYLERKNHEKAVFCFKKVTALSPESELASKGLFHSLFDMGKKDEAFAEIHRYLAIKDDDEYRTILLENKDK